MHGTASDKVLVHAKGAAIAQNLADLHGDTIELARLGSNLFKQSALNEKGEVINGGETILIDTTCFDRLAAGTARHLSRRPTTRATTDEQRTGAAQLGHSDRIGR